MSEPVQNNVVNLESYGQMRRGATSEAAQQTLDKVLDIVARALQSHLQRMLDKVDDTLFERAEKAESHAIQNQYFDAMRELRIVRLDIEQEFTDVLTRQFDQGIPRQAAGCSKFSLHHDSSNPSFNRGDSDRMEEELAITSMVNKIRGNCVQTLPLLDRRIGFLISDPDLERWHNPIGPEAVCDTFRQAARQIETTLVVRLVIFKLFDQNVASQMDALYRQVNQTLVKLGVMPELRARESGLDLTPDTPQTAAPVSADIPAANTTYLPDTSSVPMAPGIVPTRTNKPLLPEASSVPMAPGIIPVQQTMRPAPASGSLSMAAGITSVQTSLPVAPKDHAVPMAAGICADHSVREATQPSIVTLTLLQQGNLPDARDDGINIDLDDLASGDVNVLHDLKDSVLIRSMGKTDDTTIDVVTLLFDYILDDTNIPAGMRALIGRLQIPVLKVALLDDSFFGNKSHPARLLLNRLASSAVGWDEQSGTEDPLYRKIQSTVQTVIDQFEDDFSLFARLLDDLNEFLDQAEQEATAREERSAKILEGQERLKAAETTTLDEIEPRISDRGNLAFVRQFVSNHWKNLLFITCARNGKDSDAWKQAVTTMDDLIWSVKPKQSSEERHRLSLIQPRLLNNIRHGMERLSIAPTERDDFIARLVHVHSQLLGEADSTAADHGTETSPVEAPQTREHTDEVAPRREPALKADADRVVARPATPTVKARQNTRRAERTHAAAGTNSAAGIKPGTWVEFRSANGSTKRAKLSWVSPITKTLLFTDSQGLKAGNYTVDELEQLLTSGRASILDSAPLMDRAVRTVLNDRRQQEQDD